MTNKQYLLKSLSGLGVTEDDVDIILVKASLGTDDNVDIQACDLAAYNRMSVVFRGAMRNVSEGGYSVSWNLEAIKLYYNALCSELGLENVLLSRPKIRDKSNVW